MHDLHLLKAIAAALLAAFIGGLVAKSLRLPLLLGYLLAGIVVGPYTPGFVAELEAVQSVAQVGVALLMFAVGVQFSLEEIRSVRRIALFGGAIQIIGTILLGVCVGLALGWGLYGGLFLGCAICLSSTAVMMRLLEDRGELGTGHGSAMLGILVVQDLSLVVMVMVLPSIAHISASGPSAMIDVGLTLLKAGLYLFVTLFLAFRGVPVLLQRIARTGSRELFLLAVVCILFGAGYLAHKAGFSLEIGAFLAGIVMTESDYAHEVFSQVRPIRDVFASLFFVSIGMLLNPAFLINNLGAVALVVAAIVIGKALLTSFAIYVLGYHGRPAVLAGLGLAQIGEFSFVLAALGAQKKLIPDEISSVVLSAALVSLFLAPFVYGSGPKLYAWLNSKPRLSAILNRQRREMPAHPECQSEAKALILGGGRVGGIVSDAFRARKIEHVVVDYDASARSGLMSNGVPVVYGDATSEIVLRQACRPLLELVVVALPDAEMTRLAIQNIRKCMPGIHIIARVHRHHDIPMVRRVGADEVIHPETEAGVVIIQQALAKLVT